MRISDWSSDVCSSDLAYAASKAAFETLVTSYGAEMRNISTVRTAILDPGGTRTQMRARVYPGEAPQSIKNPAAVGDFVAGHMGKGLHSTALHALPKRAEEHTSELHSLLRNVYPLLFLKTKTHTLSIL